MSGAIGLIFLGGFIVTWVVLYQRAGFPDVDADWREFVFPNPLWFVLMVMKFWLWPLTLVVWLLTGRGPSRWRAVTEIDGRPARRILRVPAPVGLGELIGRR